jgi:excisionase family DNA binding protein
MSSEYLTVRQAAQQLGVSRSTVWRWIEQGRLAAFRMGGRTIRLRGADVAALPERIPRGLPRERARENGGGSDVWAHYDPEKAKEALRNGFGILKGIDVEQFKKDMKEARSQDSKGRPA